MSKAAMATQLLVCGIVLVGFVALLGARHEVPGALYIATITVGASMIGGAFIKLIRNL